MEDDSPVKTNVKLMVLGVEKELNSVSGVSFGCFSLVVFVCPFGK